LPEAFIRFVKRVTLFNFSICTWHKIQFKAIKLVVNDLRENLLLDVQNASGKPQT